MFFDKQVPHCSWCCKKIINQSVKCNGDDNLEFCDLVCAKLYDMNINNISINFREYNGFYNDNLLTVKQRKIFDYTKFMLFECFPICKMAEDLDNIKDRRKLKKYYYNVITS